MLCLRYWNLVSVLCLISMMVIDCIYIVLIFKLMVISRILVVRVKVLMMLLNEKFVFKILR